MYPWNEQQELPFPLTFLSQQTSNERCIQFTLLKQAENEHRPLMRIGRLDILSIYYMNEQTTLKHDYDDKKGVYIRRLRTVLPMDVD